MEVSKQVRGLNKVDDALLKQNAILRQRIGNFCDVPVQASGGFAPLNSKIELIDSAMQSHFTGQIIWKLAGRAAWGCAGRLFCVFMKLLTLFSVQDSTGMSRLSLLGAFSLFKLGLCFDVFDEGLGNDVWPRSWSWTVLRMRHP